MPSFVSVVSKYQKVMSIFTVAETKFVSSFKDTRAGKAEAAIWGTPTGDNVGKVNRTELSILLRVRSCGWPASHTIWAFALLLWLVPSGCGAFSLLTRLNEHLLSWQNLGYTALALHDSSFSGLLSRLPLGSFLWHILQCGFWSGVLHMFSVYFEVRYMVSESYIIWYISNLPHQLVKNLKFWILPGLIMGFVFGFERGNLEY